MPLPRSIARPAFEAQCATEPSEAMQHQLRAVRAAWTWGLSEYARRHENRDVVPTEIAKRWVALAGKEDANEEAWTVVYGAYCGQGGYCGCRADASRIERSLAHRRRLMEAPPC